MTRRETRVINAFLNCIRHGEYTVDYAITLIEDNARYGWMSEEAKDYFYEQLDLLEAEMNGTEEEPAQEPVEGDPVPAE